MFFCTFCLLMISRAHYLHFGYKSRIRVVSGKPLA